MWQKSVVADITTTRTESTTTTKKFSTLWLSIIKLSFLFKSVSDAIVVVATAAVVVAAVVVAAVVVVSDAQTPPKNHWQQLLW